MSSAPPGPRRSAWSPAVTLVPDAIPLIRRRYPRDYVTVGVELDPGGGVERRVLVTRPGIFRPFGLLLWAARHDCKVLDIRCCEQSQLLSTLPGNLFESEIGWDEFLAATRPRTPNVFLIESLRPVGQFFSMALPTIELGSAIELELEGQVEHAVFIGHMLPELEAA